MDYTLPNGTVIKGIPEGMSERDIINYAIYNNLYSPGQEATVAESPVDSYVDSAQEVLGQMGQAAVDMAPSIGGMAGGLAGAKTGLALGSFAGPLGALAGSAIGAFAGAGAGETLRQWIRGEEADVSNAIQQAVIEGSIDTVGGRAFDVFKGAKDILLNKLGYGGMPEDTTQILRNLQAKLQRGYNSTVRPSQVDPSKKIISGLESAAETALSTRDEFRIIAEGQNQFLDDQVEGFVAVADKLKGEELGVLVQNLVETTRQASSDVFGQMFRELDEVGKGVKVSVQGPRNRALAWRKNKMEGLTKRMQEKIDKGARIPFTSSDIQRAVDDILTLSPNTTFAKSFEKLKDLKSRLTAMRGNPATANDPAVAEIAALVKQFEDSILKSANKAGPEVSEMYGKLMKEYEETQKLVYSDIAVKIMEETNPEVIGKMLHEVGKTTPFNQVKKIIDYAKKLDVQTGGDILTGIRQSFLAKHLSSSEGQAMNTLGAMQRKLADPDFARTFDALIPEAQKKRLYTLITEAEILGRGVGGELALAVRSTQLAGAQGVAAGGGNAGLLANIVKVTTPAFIAKFSSNPDLTRRMLRMLKTANKYVNNPKDMPPEVYRALSLMLAKFAGEGALEYSEQQAEERMAPIRQQIQQLKQAR